MDLEQLLDDSEYKLLPLTLAGLHTQGDWQDGVQSVWEIAAQRMIWETCQRVAQLFDKYGEDVIAVVKVKTEMSWDDVPVLSSPVWINGAYVGFQYGAGGQKKRNTQIVPGVDEIDGGAMLDQVCTWIETIGSMGTGREEFSGHVDTFEAAFGQEMRSAQEARLRAAEFAPLIEAWARQHTLKSGVDTSSRASHKHKM